MMVYQIILVLMFFTGIKGEANPLFRCMEMMNFHEDVDSFLKLEDNEQYNFFCKCTTSSVNCMNNVLREKTGFTARELANHWPNGTEYGKFLNSLIKLENYVKEKCRSGTQLNKDFMTDIPCFQRGNFKVIPIKHCINQSDFVYRIFTKLQPERELSEADGECKLTAYQLGCVAATVLEECGDNGFKFFKRALKRKGFFRSGTCSSVLMQTLKTTFLKNLSMSKSRKKVFRAILGIKRRRK